MSMGNNSFKPQCKLCGDEYETARFKLGICLCLSCGDELARDKARRYTVVPMHKSNYVACFNMDDLKGINNKGGIIK